MERAFRFTLKSWENRAWDAEVNYLLKNIDHDNLTFSRSILLIVSKLVFHMQHYSSSLEPTIVSYASCIYQRCAGHPSSGNHILRTKYSFFRRCHWVEGAHLPCAPSVIPETFNFLLESVVALPCCSLRNQPTEEQFRLFFVCHGKNIFWRLPLVI